MKPLYICQSDSIDIDYLHTSYSDELRSGACSNQDQTCLEERLADSKDFWDAISLIRMGNPEGLEQLKDAIGEQIENLADSKTFNHVHNSYQKWLVQ